MEKSKILAAVWMINHPNDSENLKTMEDYVRQFDVLTQNFQSVIDLLEKDHTLD